MKHCLFLAVLAGACCGPIAIPLAAQDSPAALAERQEAEENYKRLNARLDDLFAANETLHKRLNALQDELRKLGDEVSRTHDRTKDAANQESIRQLAKAIEEVDRKRIADNERVVATLDGLKKALGERAAAAPRLSTPPTTTVSPPAAAKPPAATTAKPPTGRSPDEKGWTYTIRANDTLSHVVALLNKQGIKVSQKQIMDANPGVNWNRLQVGQSIFIPTPPQ
jgi:LysM repeat protein